jgi:hypothetical protein
VLHDDPYCSSPCARIAYGTLTVAEASQVNAPTHPQFNYGRMDSDPVYGVWAGWVVSSHGRVWGPWRGGVYPC